MYFLRKKDQAFSTYKQFEAHLKTQFGHPVKILHSDHGGEYLDKEFILHLKDAGTAQKLTVHDTPEHNGVAECYNRTITEMVRAMLHSSGLPKFLWAEAARHAVWLRNRATTKALDGTTPYEAAKGRKPDIREVREFGEKVWVKQKKVDKLSG